MINLHTIIQERKKGNLCLVINYPRLWEILNKLYWKSDKVLSFVVLTVGRLCIRHIMTPEGSDYSVRLWCFEKYLQIITVSTKSTQIFMNPPVINREKRRYIFTWYVACSFIMEISLSSNLYIQLTISWSPVTTCHCPLTNDFKKGQQIMINTWRRRVNIWDSFHLIFYSFI